MERERGRTRTLKRVMTVLILVMVAVVWTGQDADAKRRTTSKPKAKTHGEQGRTILPAPSLLPGTRPEMNAAGFWIGRHPCPDRIILGEEAIQGFNEAVRNELGLPHDISSYPAVASGEEVRNALSADAESVVGKRYYLSDGASVNRAFLETIAKRVHGEAIPPEISVRFGLVVKNADQRKLPTAERFYPGKYARNFDMLQGSVLPPGTAVAILHTTADGRWHYVAAPQSKGWVQDDKIARCSRETMAAYTTNEGFVVVTARAADLYRDCALTAYDDRLKMGTRLPLLGEHDGTVEVSVPRRAEDGTCVFSSAFLRERDVSLGYLPYTPRAIILQAFEFLNQPYAWGEMDGEQDCSSFVRSVFATVGLELPRNSSFQARAGRRIAAFDATIPLEKRREALAAAAVGGITLLGLPGHIMLYLGAVNDVPYVIHASWSYRETADTREYDKVVGRVVVASLLLGQGARHDSLLERTATVQLMAE